MRVCWTFRLERLFPLSGPQFPRPFTVFAVKLFGHSDERAENDGAIIVRQFDNAGFDDEPAEFDQMARPLSSLDLPRPHVSSGLRRPMPVACRTVAPKCRRCRRHLPVEIGVISPETMLLLIVFQT